MMALMHALVTGRAGFIGSALTVRLIADGNKADVLDDLRRGALDNSASLPDRVDVHQVDLTGTGIQTSNRALHGVVARAVAVADEPAFAPPRLGDLPASAPDPSRAVVELWWRPQCPLQDGIERTVRYFRASLES